MGLSVMLVLALSAFVCTIASALGRCPLWIPVVLLCLIALIGVMPMGNHGLMIGR